MLSYFFLHSVMSPIIQQMVASTLLHSGIISFKLKESQGVLINFSRRSSSIQLCVLPNNATLVLECS